MEESKKPVVEEGDENGGEMNPPPPPPSKEEKAEIERKEEEKLKSKFPGMPNRPGGAGHSSFLQKRLAKGQKFFDSGDYQMAKQKGRMGPGRMTMPVLAQTGEAIPTPDTVPARKTSIIQPLHDHSQALHLASDPAHQIPAVVPGQPLPNPAVTNLSS